MSSVKLLFLKAATKVVDPLFIELMLHLSHVQQMYCRPIQPKHGLILCMQNTRGRVVFNRVSVVKSPCWHWVLILWPSNPDLLCFAAVHVLQDFVIFTALLSLFFHAGMVNSSPILWSYFGGQLTPRATAVLLTTFGEISQAKLGIKTHTVLNSFTTFKFSQPNVNCCCRCPVLWTWSPSRWWRSPTTWGSWVLDLDAGWEKFLCPKMNPEVRSCLVSCSQTSHL